MNLGTLLHGSSRPASPTGRTIGTPRRYDLVTAVLFAGERRQSFRDLAVAAGIRNGDRVLDVGCGTGYFVRMLAEQVGSQGSVVGVDAAPEMVAHAASRSRSAANVSFEVGSAGALSFPDASFDVVVSSLTMHHLDHADQLPAVGEMRRVLKPGGRLLIAEFQAPQGHLWRLLLGPTGLAAMAHAVPHVESLVAEAGFANIERGEVPPVLQYVRATKSVPQGPAASSI
jgi:ubiquinone/menaquinone biosynthesis C-methylase UbiE